MGKLDYNPYYECHLCGTRIHQSRVSSISGNVICCGQNMARPGDPVIFYAVLFGITAVPLLWGLTDFGVWISLVCGIAVFVVVFKVLSHIRARGEEKARDDSATNGN